MGPRSPCPSAASRASFCLRTGQTHPGPRVRVRLGQRFTLLFWKAHGSSLTRSRLKSVPSPSSASPAPGPAGCSWWFSKPDGTSPCRTALRPGAPSSTEVASVCRVFARDRLGRGQGCRAAPPRERATGESWSLAVCGSEGQGDAGALEAAANQSSPACPRPQGHLHGPLCAVTHRPKDRGQEETLLRPSQVRPQGQKRVGSRRGRAVGRRGGAEGSPPAPPCPSPESPQMVPFRSGVG